MDTMSLHDEPAATQAPALIFLPQNDPAERAAVGSTGCFQPLDAGDE